MQTFGRSSVEWGGASVVHLLLAVNPDWGFPLGSISERNVATLPNQGSCRSIISKEMSSSCRIPCVSTLLRWMLTDLILIGCSGIGRFGVIGGF